MVLRMIRLLVTLRAEALSARSVSAKPASGETFCAAAEPAGVG